MSTVYIDTNIRLGLTRLFITVLVLAALGLATLGYIAWRVYDAFEVTVQRRGVD